MTITAVSNVGIGTAAPSRTLHIAGIMRLTTSVDVVDNRQLCTIVATGEIEFKDGACGTSASKYKENISDITYNLSDVRKLRPVFFNYLTESELADDITLYPGHDRTKRRMGFVAEEMQLIAPEAVIWSKGEIDGIDYAHLTALLAGGMQDFNQSLQDLLITGTTSASSSYAGLFGEGTVWGKMVSLVSGFVDGVLSLTGLTAKTVKTETLCIGVTCVTEAQLIQLLQPQAPSNKSTSNNTLPPTAPTPSDEDGGLENTDDSVSEDEILVEEGEEGVLMRKWRQKKTLIY